VSAPSARELLDKFRPDVGFEMYADQAALAARVEAVLALLDRDAVVDSYVSIDEVRRLLDGKA
jgi:hypothetical protein